MVNPPEGLVPLDGGSAALFSRKLSPEHRREIRELGGCSAATAIADSLAASVEAYGYQPRGSGCPVFVFGVEAKGALTNSAMVWMLASPDIAGHARGTVRAARWGIGRAFFITRAEILEQYIPPWYETGLRFAKRLGFTAEAHYGTGAVRVTLSAGRYLEERKAAWERSATPSSPPPVRA